MSEKLRKILITARRRARRLSSRARKGLTLVELAIVILVLGIIMGIVYSSLDFGITDDAKKLMVASSSKQLTMVWEKYEAENAPLEEGTKLDVLAAKNPDKPGWRPVDVDMVMDPWKRPYFVCKDDRGERQLCSLGADGQQGGENQNADFYLTDRASWPAWLSGKKTQQ